jgi:hypothetical protein
MPTNWTESGLLPAAVADSVLTAVEQESAVLALATTRRMPAGVEYLPLQASAPKAQWLDAPGDRKPYAPIEWSAERLTAHELALITYVEDVYIDDTTFDIEAETERVLGSAIAEALDAAILFGENAPPGFPPNGIVGAPISGANAPEAIDQALSAVEASGAIPDGIIAGSAIGSAMRQAYLAAQALPSERPADAVFGIPTRVSAVWDPSRGDAVVGAWRFLIVGIRQDIRVETSREGTLTDPPISAFESDVTLVRAHARFACAIGKPVAANGQPIEPFATASWSGGASGAASSAGGASAPTTRRKASDA